jgi:hypothetical protein
MQIKTTLKFHLTPVKMDRIKNTTTANAGKDVAKQDLYTLCEWECKLVQPLWKTAWRFLKKTRARTALQSSDTTPGHTQKKVKQDIVEIPGSLQHHSQ